MFVWCLSCVGRSESPPQHLYRIMARVLTGPFQTSQPLSFDSFLGWIYWNVLSLSCCMMHISFRFNFLTDGTAFSSSILWYNKEYIVDSMLSWPILSVVKQQQTMTFPPPMLYSWYQAFVPKCSLISAQIILLWSHMSKENSSRSFCLSRCVLLQISPSFNVVLTAKVSYSKKKNLFSLYLMVDAPILISTVGSVTTF